MENVNIVKMCFVILFIFMCNRTVAHNLDEGILIDTDADRLPIAKEYFVRTDDKDVNLYDKEVGQGKPVIVLHGGFGNDHINVIKIANGLEKNFRFILYNQRGLTLSYCEKENILVENHLKDLETIKRKLKLDNFTLVSHSMETVLAFLYLQNHPERIRVSILILLGAMNPKNGNHDYFTEEEKQTLGLIIK